VATSIGTKVPNTRTITINGTAYDLSADRSWTINSMVYPGAGIAVSTGSAWGTSITNNSTNWNTAYGWGNHASAGYLTGITSSQVTTALGFTPYNSTNPSGYISSYTETDTLATVTGRGSSTTSELSFNSVATLNGSGDWTNATTYTYKINPSSSYWRILHLSANSTVSGVYTYQTGKSVYWGEDTDTGDYSFRGRTLKSGSNTVWHAGNLTNLNQLSNGPGYITSSSGITGAAGRLSTRDLRTIAPNSENAAELRFGFTSWANNNTSPWADYLHLRSYSDGSGGSDNLVMFLKSGIGMRIWQQSFGSGTAYSSYVDVLHTSNYTSYALSTGGGSVNGSVKVISATNDASGFTNSDLGSAFYTDRGGRLLTSNGTNWASDGRDPALVISGSYSDTNRGRIGLALHNETTSNNAFAPMIAFSSRSQSGGYNTVYASIMGRYTGHNTGVDTNWAKGELHFYAHGDTYVDDTPTMRLTGAGFLQVASGGGSSTATLSLLQTGYSNAYIQYSAGKLQIGGDSGLSDGIYFNMYNGSGYGDRVVIKPSGRVNIISGSRTLSLGDGNYSNHILVDSNVDFAFNYNNGSTGGFGFFGGTSSAKFMCSYTGTLTVSGDVVAYGSPSDIRLKDIKEKIPNALDSILKLNGYRFDWKEKELDIYGDDKKILHIKEDIGVIAQEVADVLPELAKTNEDGFMSVRYQGLTAVLIEAMKEQQNQIEELKVQNDALKEILKRNNII
jgi:hypothetical protein